MTSHAKSAALPLNRQMTETDPDEIDLLQIVRTLWRGKFLILLAMFVAAILSGYYAFGIAVPTYRATAQMALQLRNETMFDFQSALTGISSDQSSMNTEMEVIKSRELLSRLVAALDLDQDPEFNATLRPDPGFTFADVKNFIRAVAPGIERLPVVIPTDQEIYNGIIENAHEAITTTVDRQSYVFSISATTQDPDKSALMANTLAQIYRDDQIGVKVAATQDAAVWLSDRVAELQGELEAGQAEINVLRTNNALVSPEALAALGAQSVELQSNLQTAEAALARAQAAHAAAVAVAGASYEARAEALQDAQLLAVAPGATGGDAAAIQRFNRRFQLLILQLGGDVDRAQELVDDLRGTAERLSRQFEQQSAQLIEIQQKERELEATRILHESFLTRLKETTVQIGVQQADSRLLSEATPGEIVAPKKTRLIAIAMVLGAIVGSGLVLLRESMQVAFRSAQELESASGLAVLGQIPRIRARDSAAKIAYLAKNPSSRASEAFRDLRTSVLLSNVDKPPKIIMSTSSIPSEGKTTNAVSLAANFAGLDKKVLLVECDIRRRTFTGYFPEAGDRKGIISVLSGDIALDEAVFRHPTYKFDILMGEKSTINAADVFSSDRFKALLATARGAYDYVIVDTPPVLVVPDARIIGPQVDAVIYSVKWDATPRALVEEGLAQLRKVNVRVAGLVLSQVNLSGLKRYGYGNRYGSYDRYGKGYYEN